MSNLQYTQGMPQLSLLNHINITHTSSHAVFSYIYFMCMSVLPECMPDILRSQKMLDPLKLKLLTIVSHRVGAGKQTQVPSKVRKYS